jgi:hypothetical protein
MFNGLGPSVLSGLIDGEERNVKSYNDALIEPGDLKPLLTVERDRLSSAIVKMHGAQL